MDDGMDEIIKRLAVPQLEMLRRIRDRGFTAWCTGRRAGGATARMADRLVVSGHLSGPPYEITDAGREALRVRAKATQEGTVTR